MKPVFLLCFVALIPVALCLTDDEKWEQHKEKFNLHFEGDKEESAKETFLETAKAVEKNQKDQMKRAGKPAVGMKLNENSHLSDEEFKKGALGLIRAKPMVGTRKLQEVQAGKPVQSRYYTEPYQLSGIALPKELDWRTFGAVNVPDNQNPCGSCYIFAGVAALEGQHFLRKNQKVKISEQFVRDCIFNPKYSYMVHDSCKGADTPQVYQLAGAVGLTPASDYKYNQDDRARACPSPSHPIIMNVTNIGQAKGEREIMEALVTVGPIAVGIDADELAARPWNQYDGKTPSIYTSRTCSAGNINHSVLLIGYGTDKTSGLDYWLIRNSWGSTWGDKGAFKIARRTDCGASVSAEWPCLDGKCKMAKTPAMG